MDLLKGIAKHELGPGVKRNRRGGLRVFQGTALQSSIAAPAMARRPTAAGRRRVRESADRDAAAVAIHAAAEASESGPDSEPIPIDTTAELLGRAKPRQPRARAARPSLASAPKKAAAKKPAAKKPARGEESSYGRQRRQPLVTNQKTAEIAERAEKNISFANISVSAVSFADLFLGIHVINPLLDEGRLRSSGSCRVRVRVIVGALSVFGARVTTAPPAWTVESTARRRRRNSPANRRGSAQACAPPRSPCEVAVATDWRAAFMRSSAGSFLRPPRESRGRRRSRASAAARRRAERSSNLREIGPVDQRLCRHWQPPNAYPARGERGGEEGQRRGAVRVRVDRLLEADSPWPSRPPEARHPDRRRRP